MFRRRKNYFVFLLMISLSLNILLITSLYDTEYFNKSISILKRFPDNYYRKILMIKPSPAKLYRSNKFQVKDINCKKIFEGDVGEIKRSKNAGARNYQAISDDDYIQRTRDCPKFRLDRGYEDYTVTDSEKNFPIAYSIIVHNDIEQIERLLRSIYRSHNVYCLHIDRKSTQKLKNALYGIASCFANIFIATKLEYVVYASMSRLQADLNCMSDLLFSYVKWKYLINLAGKSFPLKTNSEIVKILTIYNGTNDIEGITGKRALLHRAKFKYKLYGRIPVMVRTNVSQPKPPHNITLVKGSAYGVFSRDFVSYVITNSISKILLLWMKDIYSPDEFFWSTLHHSSYNAHLIVPGSYKGIPDKKLWLASYSAWSGVDTCQGKWVRDVCIFSTGDIAAVYKQKHLFANKFYLGLNPYAIGCLEELLYNRTVEHSAFNTTFYEQLSFVRH